MIYTQWFEPISIDTVLCTTTESKVFKDQQMVFCADSPNHLVHQFALTPEEYRFFENVPFNERMYNSHYFPKGMKLIGIGYTNEIVVDWQRDLIMNNMTDLSFGIPCSTILLFIEK
ncbi:hypothetical protein bcgnr5372_46670 [Bacillus luti]|nr:hypothetical protein [Bacillus cereus]